MLEDLKSKSISETAVKWTEQIAANYSFTKDLVSLLKMENRENAFKGVYLHSHYRPLAEYLLSLE